MASEILLRHRLDRACIAFVLLWTTRPGVGQALALHIPTPPTPAHNDTRPPLNFIAYYDSMSAGLKPESDADVSPCCERIVVHHAFNCAPAAEIAVQMINEADSLLPDYRLNIMPHFASFDWGLQLGKQGVGLAWSMRNLSLLLQQSRNDDGPAVPLVIGPGWSAEALPEVLMLQEFGVVTVAFAITDDRLSDKTRYPHFFRTAAPNSVHAVAIAEVMVHFSWLRNLAVVSETHAASKTMAGNMMSALGKHGGVFTTVQQVEHTEIEYAKLGRSLAAQQNRIIVMFALYKSQNIYCAMAKNGLKAADGVLVLTFDFHYQFDLTDAQHQCVDKSTCNCEADVLESTGFGSMRHIFEMGSQTDISDATHWPNVSNGDVVERVNKWRVKQYAKADPRTIDKLAGYEYYLFDAMYAGVVALSRFTKERKRSLVQHRYGDADVQQQLTELVRETDFVGMTGRLQFNDKHDRIIDEQIYQFQGYANKGDKVGKEIVVGQVKGRVDGWTTVINQSAIMWGTEDGLTPLDVPPEQSNTLVIVVTIIVGVLIVVALIAAACFAIQMKRQHRQLSLAHLNWELHGDQVFDEMEVVQAPTGGLASMAITDPDNAAPIHSAFITRPFRGSILACVVVNEQKPPTIDKWTIEELSRMREMHCPNVGEWVGCVVDQAERTNRHNCICYKWYSKGSLLEVLLASNFLINAELKHSFFSDVCTGMAYLHQSAIGSHGQLSSYTVLVGTRFCLKIVDYGLASFRDHHVSTAPTPQRLYVAPELLRRGPDAPKLGTQSGDSWSLAIVLFETATRQPCFTADRSSPEADLLVDEIAQLRVKPDVNDVLAAELEMNDGFVRLLQRMLSEVPDERPLPADDVRASMRAILKEEGFLDLDIVSRMLAHMETWTSALEAQVQERTAGASHERGRTERLLGVILPPSVCAMLMKGIPVDPEAFESTTMGFSDLIGFQDVSAKSRPQAIIAMLNATYNDMDEALAKRPDIYKVETINDSYMIVSGLPTRNGSEHVRQVALAALHLMYQCQRWLEADRVATIARLESADVDDADELAESGRAPRLPLRFGIHSGPTVAGVVGTKRPAYNLFGDTVNTTSRMMSTGAALRIHMSPTTKATLTAEFPQFDVVDRGLIPIKGKGEMNTYWLDNDRELANEQQPTWSAAERNMLLDGCLAAIADLTHMPEVFADDDSNVDLIEPDTTVVMSWATADDSAAVSSVAIDVAQPEEALVEEASRLSVQSATSGSPTLDSAIGDLLPSGLVPVGTVQFEMSESEHSLQPQAAADEEEPNEAGGEEANAPEEEVKE